MRSGLYYLFLVDDPDAKLPIMRGVITDGTEVTYNIAVKNIDSPIVQAYQGKYVGQGLFTGTGEPKAVNIDKLQLQRLRYVGFQPDPR